MYIYTFEKYLLWCKNAQKIISKSLNAVCILIITAKPTMNTTNERQGKTNSTTKHFGMMYTPLEYAFKIRLLMRPVEN
jgi:hypothetical protein